MEANATIESGKEYEVVGEVKITAASSSLTRTTKLSVKFKLTLDEPEVVDEEEKPAANETSSDNSTAAASTTTTPNVD